MKCERPSQIRLEVFRCGKCEDCRRYQRRVLTTRLYLEAGLHRATSFVTLTYEDDRPALCKRDPQLFVKRLRQAISPLRVRYLVSGEYGDRYGRPHYHGMLFGLEAGLCRDLIQSAWNLGFIQVASFSLPRAMYISGYVLKKQGSESTGLKWPVRPFTLRSLKPGLGYGAADVLASFYKTRVGKEEFARQGDVGGGIRIDGRIWPLGDYLRAKVRALAGLEVDRKVVLSFQRSRQVVSASRAGAEVMGQYFAERVAESRSVRGLEIKRSSTHASL